MDFTLNIDGHLRQWRGAAVMGILNVTPDSFYEASRFTNQIEIEHRTLEMIAEGVDIIDLGACSTRPGSVAPDEEIEIKRIVDAVRIIRSVSSDVLISIDTYRSAVAQKAITAGGNIINDISGGDFDSKMFDVIADLKVPYVIMHTRGTPDRMQSMTDYSPRGVVSVVMDDLASKINNLALRGVSDIIVDPGFGFAKTVSQNYKLMTNLGILKKLECPILVGVSRKSMITRLLDISTDEALNGTTALNMFALCNGASILRVHDIREARQTVRIYNELSGLSGL